MLFSGRRCVTPKKFCSRQLSFLTPLEEFPHTHTHPASTSPATVAAVKESVLKNGIKLVTYENAGAKSTQIQVAILAGSRSETIEQKGAAKLATGGIFFGTILSSGLRIFRNIENHGATLTGRADRDKIVFELTALPDHINTPFAALAETVTRPVKPTYMYKGAKEGAVGVEQAKYESSPEDKVVELLYEAGYGELTPLGGSQFPENLEGLSEVETAIFAKNNFIAENVLITASGIAHDSLKALVEKWMGKFPSGKSIVNDSPYVGGETRVRVDLAGKSVIGVAFPVPASAGLAGQVLFASLQKRLGSTAAKSFFNTHKNESFFGFVFSGETAASTEALHSFVGQLKEIATVPADFASVKKTIKLNHSLALDGNGASLSILNKVVTGVDALNVDQVTNKDVADLAAKLLKTVPSYSVLGKTFGTPKLADLLKKLH